MIIDDQGLEQKIPKFGKKFQNAFAEVSARFYGNPWSKLDHSKINGSVCNHRFRIFQGVDRRPINGKSIVNQRSDDQHWLNVYLHLILKINVEPSFSNVDHKWTTSINDDLKKYFRINVESTFSTLIITTVDHNWCNIDRAPNLKSTLHQLWIIDDHHSFQRIRNAQLPCNR